MRSPFALAAGIAVLPLIVSCTERSSQSSGAGATGTATGAAAQQPPDSFRVTFETSRGPFVVQIVRAWAPIGADRFFALVNKGFFDDSRFFRVVPGFVVQFGLNADPAGNKPWDKRLLDDSVTHTNARGTIVFATQGPNTRTHQLFINLADNAQLDGMGFAPMGRVVDGMSVVDSLYSGYGESPDQELIQRAGNSYLDRDFPKLDRIKAAKVGTAP